MLSQTISGAVSIDDDSGTDLSAYIPEPCLEDETYESDASESDMSLGLAQDEDSVFYPCVSPELVMKMEDLEQNTPALNDAKCDTTKRCANAAHCKVRKHRQGKAYIQSGRPLPGRLTEKDKSMLRKWIGGAPWKRLNQEELRPLIPNLNEKKWKAAKLYLSKVVRPELKLRADLEMKHEIALRQSLSEEQLFAMFLYFGRRDCGTVRPRSQRNIVEFLRIYSHLFARWKPCRRTCRKIQDAWRNTRRHTVCTEITVL